jgi:phosphate starvation-inducible PhoH-like protein
MASKITLTEPALRSFSGVHEQNLRHLESVTGARVSARDEQVTIEGAPEQVELAGRILEGVSKLVAAGLQPTKGDWEAACRLVAENPAVDLAEHFLKLRIQPSAKKSVVPKTANQLAYAQAIRQHDISFAIGPAGTGKTYLAVALALEALREERVSRIVLTRPAVEAGERLGFLPGDIAAKVDPYLRPLHDAIFDLMDRAKAQVLLENGVIEVAPLAFMRGRTLNDSFNILDEAQNTTSEQMKMFLTRMGMNSKAVITGDITQIDLPPGKPSGLVEARRVLGRIQGIAFAELTDRDVIRHRLVQKIVQAYEAYLKRQQAPGKGEG